MSIYELLSPIIGAAGSILQNQVQNQQSKENIEHAAAVNYGYGEMAADSAQARTKALFNELYSPEAKVKQLKNAGLSVGLMYGQGGAGGTSSTAGAMGQGAGAQQAKQPLGILQNAELGLMAAQAKKLNAEADNINADTDNKEKERLKLVAEEEKARAEIARIEGETALQSWSQRQLMTISDSELNAYSNGKSWTQGWSFGESSSESSARDYGANVGVTVKGFGGSIGGKYGKSDATSAGKSESENKGGSTSISETKSTSGSRSVLVWPKIGKNGNLEHIYMFILDGDYKNMKTEIRMD